MKINLLSGILLILLLITGTYAYMQKVDADAARKMAEQNEAIYLVSQAESSRMASEAKRYEELAVQLSDQLQACLATKR